MRETAIREVGFPGELCIPKNGFAFEAGTGKQGHALKDGARKIGVCDKSRFPKVGIGNEIDLAEIGRPLEAGTFKGHGAFEPAFIEKRPRVKCGVGEIRITGKRSFGKMGIVLEVDARKIRLACKPDFVETKRFGEERTREVNVALELRSGEFTDSVEFSSLETGPARELSVSERHFVDELHVPEIRVVKDFPIETRKWFKSRLAHGLVFSELAGFFQPLES
jgi:hypothetical protein